MPRSLLRFVALCCCAATLLASFPAAAAPAGGVEPLPKRCTGVTPPGQAEPVCCLNGFVYLDGVPLAQAEVTVSVVRGGVAVALSTITQPAPGEEQPFFQLSLSAPPLNIAPGETIRLEARYGGAQAVLNYLVLAGSQQVDLLLRSPDDGGYLFERRIRSGGEGGKWSHISDLAVDSSGLVYATDRDDSRVQVFNSGGQLLREWGGFGRLPGQFNNPAAIAIDGSNNVYVVDTGNRRVQKFSKQGALLATIATYGPDSRQLVNPTDVATDSTGNLYLLDGGAERVITYSSGGSWLASFPASTDEGALAVRPDGGYYLVYSDADGAIIFSYSSSGQRLGALFRSRDDSEQLGPLALDSEGFLYTRSSRHPGGIWQESILKLAPDGQIVGELGRLGSARGQFDGVTGIAVDSFGTLYVADSGNHRVQRFRNDFVWMTQWGSSSRASGQFDQPQGLAADDAGRIFVADRGGERVQMLNATGEWLATWDVFGPTGGERYLINDIALDGAGFAYVLDGAFIHKMVIASGRAVKTWRAAALQQGQTGLGERLALSPTGSLFVSDPDNNAVHQFTLDGKLVRNLSATGSGSLSGPQGLAVDGQGNLYVLETFGGAVQIFNADGSWTGAVELGEEVGGNFFRKSLNNATLRLLADGTFVFGQSRAVYVGARNGDRVLLKRVYNSPLPSDPLTPSGDPGVIGSISGLAVAPDGRIALSDGAKGSVLVLRPSSLSQPIATINQLSSPSVGPDNTLIVRGMGQSGRPDGAIVAYRWASDRDGPLGEGQTLTRAGSSLSAGSHRITLEVQDSAGVWSAPVAASIYVAPPPVAAWTMLLYLAGDYNDRGRLLESFQQSLDALRTTFRNPQVRIAALVDGPGNGDSRRVLMTPGTATSPPEVIETAVGEAAMDDPVTLAAFVRWGQQTFPASHYYLAIADHGQGVQGIGWDTTSDPTEGAYLTVAELGQALSSDGIAPIDLLHLDACSMNLLEVAYEVRQNVGVLVASQYLGWSYFAYSDYAEAMGADVGAPELGVAVGQSYAARARTDSYPFTIAALDLGKIAPTLLALDGLAGELTALAENDGISRTLLANIWGRSRTFESNGDFLNNDLDMYVDLLDWAQRVRVEVARGAVPERAATLIDALSGPQGLIVADSNQAGSGPLPPKYAGGALIDLAGSNGVSIFYPQRQDSAAFSSYVTNRTFAFTRVSRWPDFLLAGVGALPGPGTALDPLPGPLAPLGEPTNTTYRALLPIVMR